MDWLGITEWVALVLVVVLLVPVVFLGVRRRWLSRQGGLFDCSLRLSEKTPGAGWVLGVARYSGDNLEWFRAFSIALRPRVIFPRSQASAGPQRDPSPIESVVLYDDQRIMRLELVDGRSWELATSVASLTGLLSWLESAPPGARYR
ncbi:MAG: DUF2550 domain-containing protein [Propionicimonas sp.]|uniref:DUF2550 domain-containing protein n=1 Tax=Propionicimonas sp. TaxID=1955623 RepID=UPI003D0AE404